MADQTSVEWPSARDEAPATVFARNFGECARDIVNLAELQSQLLAVDVKQSARRMTVPAVLLVLAVVMILGSFPVLLMTIAYALIEGAGWPHWAGFLLATGIGFLVGGVLAASGYMLLRNAIPRLERSRKELADNLRWLKDSLSAGGRLRHRQQCE
jgi:hypothetical protein